MSQNALLITQLFDLINKFLKLDLYDNTVFYSENYYVKIKVKK